MEKVQVGLVDGVGSLLRVDLFFCVSIALRLVEATLDGFELRTTTLIVVLHDGRTLTRLHHRQDLRESLTVLIIDTKVRYIQV